VPFNAEIKELEQVAILFDKIRDLHKELNPALDHQMGNYFDQNINRVLSWLKEVMNDPSVSSKAANGLKAKHDILELCFDKLVEYCSQVDEGGIDPRITEIMESIKFTDKKIVIELYKIAS